MLLADLLDDRRKIAKVAKARLQKDGEQHFYFEDPVEYAQHRYGIVLPPDNFHFFRHETKMVVAL